MGFWNKTKDHTISTAEEPKVDPKAQFLADGVEWLIRAGALESPEVQTALALNVYVIDERVENVSFVIDSRELKLLVYIELQPLSPKGFFNKLREYLKSFFKEVPSSLTDKEICSIALDKLHEVLPQYDMRVTSKLEVYQKSLEVSNRIREEREKSFKKERN